MSGFEAWHCYCGAKGEGGAAALRAHALTHPVLRMWLGGVVAQAAVKLEALAWRLRRLVP